MKCTIVSDIYEHVHQKIQDSIIFGQTGLRHLLEEFDYNYFCQTILLHA